MRLTQRGHAVVVTVVALLGITAALAVLDLMVWALSTLLGVQGIPTG